MKKKILVTGGSGFWGNDIVRRLKDEFEVYYTYFTNKTEIPGAVPLYADLNRMETVAKILDEIRFSSVIHAAAMTDPDTCEKNRIGAYRMNVKAAEKLAMASSWMGFSLIFLSSDLVFSGGKGGYTEYDLPDSKTVYGKTKLLAEQKIIGLTGNYIILRLALTYGKSSGLKPSFTDQMYDKFISGGKVFLFTDQFRTPLFIDDGLDIIEKCVSSDISGKVFNLGGPERISRADFGLLFSRIMGLDSKLIEKCRITELPKMMNRGADCSMDSSRAERFFSMKFKTPSAGLKKLKDCYPAR